MPRLKLMVESAIHRYLTGQLTDEGFKGSILSILNEFEGKNLLHQNIGQLTWGMEKQNSSRKSKFEKIWILFDQVNPRIREDFDRRMRKAHTKWKEPKMKELKVRIVRLEPMHVASVRAISQTPEHDAWEKMRAWAEPRGLLEDLDKHPVFGFNNPPPSPDRNEYSYEFWIRVEPETKPEGEVKITEFKGGLYALTTCNLKEELESEFFEKEGYLESWKRLAEWVKNSKYRCGKHQGLEKTHDPTASEEELILDLYCPIEE